MGADEAREGAGPRCHQLRHLHVHQALRRLHPRRLQELRRSPAGGARLLLCLPLLGRAEDLPEKAPALLARSRGIREGVGVHRHQLRHAEVRAGEGPRLRQEGGQVHPRRGGRPARRHLHERRHPAGLQVHLLDAAPDPQPRHRGPQHDGQVPEAARRGHLHPDDPVLQAVGTLRPERHQADRGQVRGHGEAPRRPGGSPEGRGAGAPRRECKVAFHLAGLQAHKGPEDGGEML